MVTAYARVRWRGRTAINDTLQDTLDIEQFIHTHLRVEPAPAIPEISLYRAHSGSGLWRLDPDGDAPSPYWAYNWAGGTVLARYFLEHPESVRAKSVLDLGAGSGLVGIAAIKSGASHVIASEIDPNAHIAMKLNMAVNGVALIIEGNDLLDAQPPNVDMIAVSDLFYAPEVAARLIPFLDRCIDSGIAVLVGDPGRAHLPLDRLHTIATYPVPDFGNTIGNEMQISAVYSFQSRQK